MDWLSAVLGQQGGNTSAVGESYLTEMDRLKQQKALMEALRGRGMQGGHQDQMVGGGSNGSFGERPGILVPGNNAGTVLADLAQTAMGQYAANKADRGMTDLAGRNDQEFRAALEKGGFPQGNTGNFPQALPRQQAAQGAILGASGEDLSPSSTISPDSSFTETPISGAEMIDIAKMRKQGMSDADIAATMTAAAGGEAGALAEPEIADPDVAAISASIPASGNMEPMLSGREKWMIQTAHDFPKSAASMNSMLQAEANTRRDLENAPLKMALAEMRINQAADVAAMRASSAREVAEIRATQARELEAFRQQGRIALKKTAPAAPPPKASLNAQGGSDAFAKTLKTMREMYANLDKSKGVTNVNNTTVQNAKAYAMSTGPGQILSKALGTKDQSYRNTINSSRPLLIRGIAEATGMSAKNIDSNAELKLWLDAASSPGDDLDSSLRALDNIEAWVNSKNGGKSSAPAPAGKTVKREVKLKDGRIGVEYSDGSRGYK